MSICLCTNLLSLAMFEDYLALPPGVLLAHLSPKLFGVMGASVVTLGKGSWTHGVQDTGTHVRELSLWENQQTCLSLSLGIKQASLQCSFYGAWHVWSAVKGSPSVGGARTCSRSTGHSSSPGASGYHHSPRRSQHKPQAAASLCQFLAPSHCVTRLCPLSLRV